jgi:SAM-dependent methyltransferase
MKSDSVKQSGVRQESIFEENLRHYAIWHFIRYKRIADLINGSDGKYLLDVGCGIGLQDLLIVDKDVISIDIDRRNLVEAKEVRKRMQMGQATIHTLVGDIHSLPLNKEFDVILCSEVLEHLAHDRMALASLLTVLKEDGLLFLTLPNRLRLELSQLFRFSLRVHCIQPDHIREYTVTDVPNLVRSFPLKIENITGVYFDFPLFHALILPIRVPINLQFSNKFLFFAYLALYDIYTKFWMPLERLFWHHAYHILIELRRTSLTEKNNIC